LQVIFVDFFGPGESLAQSGVLLFLLGFLSGVLEKWVFEGGVLVDSVWRNAW